MDKKAKAQLNKLEKELRKAFDRWEYIYEEGTSDPFWEDGVNLNLVRNHIIYGKKQIEEICNKEGVHYPEIYYKKTPLKVDNLYMARKDEIKSRAVKALDQYRIDNSVRELKSIYKNITNKEKKEQGKRLIDFDRNLEQAIDKNDFVEMRRWLDYKRRIQEVEEFIKELDENDFSGQLSVFSLL